MKTVLRTLAVIITLLASFTLGAASLSLSASMVSLPAMNPVTINTFSAVRGNLGEAMTDYDYLGRLAKTGWKTITPRTAAQGLDHIALQFDSKGVLKDVLVVETKYTRNSVADALGDTLDGRQMSSSWVLARVKKDVVSLYDDYIASDSSVSIRGSVPDDATRKVYIDNDSCYFTDSDGNKCFYSSSDEMVSDNSKRTARAKATSENLLRYAESTDIRRRIVKFDQDDNGTLHRHVYEVADGETDRARTVSYRLIEETTVSDDSLSTVLSSVDYKQSVARLYNLEDTSVLDKLTETQLLKLNRGLDNETAQIVIFSSKTNSRQFAIKLGLNEGMDFSNLGFTDAQMKKITAAANLDDIDDADVVKTLKQKSNAATRKQMGIHAGVALVSGFGINIIQQGLVNGWDSLNLLEAGRVGLFTAGLSLAKDTAEGLTKGLIKTGVKNVKAASTLINVTPFAVDALFDVGFVAYRYLNGDYAYTSQAIAEGALNIAFDAAGGALTYALLPVVTTKMTALFAGAGTLVGPIGTAAGIVVGLGVGAVLSFGSHLLVQPISDSLEVRGLWKDLDSNFKGNVSAWTKEYLSE